MTGKELLEGMSFVKDEIVQESEERPSRKRQYIRLLSMAACLCVVIAGAFAWEYFSRPQQLESAGSVASGMDGAENLQQYESAGNTASEIDREANLQQESAVEPPEDMMNYPFEAQYIRISADRTELEEPEMMPNQSVRLIRSARELDEYLQQNKALAHSENSETGEALPVSFERYGEAFFSEKDLLLITPEQESNISGYEIQSLHPDSSDGWVIEGTVFTQDDGAADEAQWQILLEIPKDLITPDDKIVLNFQNG